MNLKEYDKQAYLDGYDAGLRRSQWREEALIEVLQAARDVCWNAVPYVSFMPGGSAMVIDDEVLRKLKDSIKNAETRIK